MAGMGHPWREAKYQYSFTRNAIAYFCLPSTWVVGSHDPYEILGQWQFEQNIPNLYYRTVFFNFFIDTTMLQLLALCDRGKVTISSWKCLPVNRSTTQHPLLNEPLLLVHSMTLTAERILKPQFRWGCHLYSPLTTCYQNTVVGLYCTLCVQIVWPLHDGNQHGAPWQSALFTSNFWSEQCIKVAFTSTAMIEIIFGPDW